MTNETEDSGTVDPIVKIIADCLDQDGPDKFGDSIRSAVDVLEERGAQS